MAKRKANILLPIIFIILSLSITFNIILVIHEGQKNIVVRVVDGDTFTLTDGRRARLLGVDAPEMGRCMSEEAKARLSELVLGKYVRLKDVGYHDDYGRILASVLVDAPFDKWMEYLYFRFVKKAPYKNLVMINRVMVEEGLGLYHNSGGQYTEVLSGASQLARTGKLGIYSETCTQISPKNPTCLIKANIRNNKKTYFLPSCFNYADVTISTSFGDAWFCTENEAIHTGFLISSTCNK